MTNIVPETAFRTLCAVTHIIIIVPIFCGERGPIVPAQAVPASAIEAINIEKVHCSGIADGKHIIVGVNGTWSLAIKRLDDVIKGLDVNPQRAGASGQ